MALPREIPKSLDYYGLTEYVNIVLDADDAGTRSEKILKVADIIGEPGSEIYMISDSVRDIWAAR